MWEILQEKVYKIRISDLELSATPLTNGCCSEDVIQLMAIATLEATEANVSVVFTTIAVCLSETILGSLILFVSLFLHNAQCTYADG